MTESNQNIDNEDGELDGESEWRRLALQFDGHRMKALWHLKTLLKNPDTHREAVEQFLSEGPLSGEEILAERIQAIVNANK